MTKMSTDKVVCPMSGNSFYKLTVTVDDKTFMLILDIKTTKDQVEAGFRKLATQMAMGDAND